MSKASDPQDAQPPANGDHPPSRSWAADIEAELPALLDVVERDGAGTLDEENCSRVLVLAGRAAQLGREGDNLDALVARALRHLPTLLQRAPLTSPDLLIDRTDVTLAGRQDPWDGPLDALLDDDDWLTVHGLASQSNLPTTRDADPDRLADAVSALVSLYPDRVTTLAEFATARMEGLEPRAHEARAWTALLGMWSAVTDAPTAEAAMSLPVAVAPSSESVDAALAAVLARHSVWSTADEVQQPLQQFVGVFFAPDVIAHTPRASGLGLPEVKPPQEVARWGDCRLTYAAGGPDLLRPILQLDGRRPEQVLEATCNGEPVRFDHDEFGVEVADAPAGRYRVVIDGEAKEFELREHRERSGT